MKIWLLILGSIYIITLAFLAIRSRHTSKNLDDFLLGGIKMGLLIGLLTTAATLFSTFTLMGMPDFFRVHGVAAWIFLGVSDGAMVFGIIVFAYYLRKKVKANGFKGVGGMLRDSYQNRWAGIIFFVSVFIFLIPYVAIQIRGLSVFLDNAIPMGLQIQVLGVITFSEGSLFWSILLFVAMLVYSETGGLKTIIYADVLQAVLLMVVVWAIAVGLLREMGGLTAMFDQVESLNPALLSAPGPKGLFSPQFLFATFIAILMVPVTQPHITTRLVIMKSIKETHRMAVGLGFFAILVIFPTVIMGMYGAIHYADLNSADYWASILINDQAGLIAAAAVIGLVAAGISTSDSQIFAMGAELRALLSPDTPRLFLITRIAIILFALAALGFSMLSSNELVLLALAGFSGTALLGPMILLAVFQQGKASNWILLPTVFAEILFISWKLKAAYMPTTFFGLNWDWFLWAVLMLLALALYFGDKQKVSAKSQESEISTASI